MTTLQCAHCNTDLQVDEHTLAVAHKHTNGTFVCPDCTGRRQYPDDVPECDIQDCEMPAPFTITTQNGEIHRCPKDLRQELNGESLISWRFYRGEDSR